MREQVPDYDHELASERNYGDFARFLSADAMVARRQRRTAIGHRLGGLNGKPASLAAALADDAAMLAFVCRLIDARDEIEIGRELLRRFKALCVADGGEKPMAKKN